MRITNKLGLPEPIVQACIKDYEITPGRYGVTSLLKGATQVVLERRHGDDIEQDVSQMIWALFGTAVHAVLEKAEVPGILKEHRIEAKIPELDATISGILDLYDPETACVSDYKTASVWKFKMQDFDDWRKQLGHYAWMMNELGYEVERGEIVAFLKDHSKLKAKLEPDYPQLPVARVIFEFDERSNALHKQEAIERVRKIKELEKLTDDEMPPCEPSERWNTGDKFAVMAKGKKRALRVLDTREEAERILASGRGEYIEERPGQDKRCAEYCSVSHLCPFWRAKNEKDNRAS